MDLENFEEQIESIRIDSLHVSSLRKIPNDVEEEAKQDRDLKISFDFPVDDLENDIFSLMKTVRFRWPSQSLDIYASVEVNIINEWQEAEDLDIQELFLQMQVEAWPHVRDRLKSVLETCNIDITLPEHLHLEEENPEEDES